MITGTGIEEEFITQFMNDSDEEEYDLLDMIVQNTPCEEEEQSEDDKVDEVDDSIYTLSIYSRAAFIIGMINLFATIGVLLLISMKGA